MSDQELKDLVASLAVESKKTDEQLRKTEEFLRNSKEQMDSEIKDLKESQKDMQKIIKNLGLNIDGINKTTGLEAEEFFYSSFENKKEENAS